MVTKNTTYTISFNRSKKTYTIRAYDKNGKVYSKYRSYPQGDSYSETWTQNDIRQFLRSNDYYVVK
ncbi:MAG: hypothetical protein ACI358_06635 [Candidatus Limimorpha sp.]